MLLGATSSIVVCFMLTSAGTVFLTHVTQHSYSATGICDVGLGCTDPTPAVGKVLLHFDKTTETCFCLNMTEYFVLQLVFLSVFGARQRVTSCVGRLVRAVGAGPLGAQLCWG